MDTQEAIERIEKIGIANLHAPSGVARLTEADLIRFANDAKKWNQDGDTAAYAFYALLGFVSYDLGADAVQRIKDALNS